MIKTERDELETLLALACLSRLTAVVKGLGGMEGREVQLVIRQSLSEPVVRSFPFRKFRFMAGSAAF